MKLSLPTLLCLLAVLTASLASAADLPAKTKFKDGQGHEAFSLKLKDDGAKLVDASGQELARFKWKGDALKVSGPDDTVLAYITGTPDKLKVKDATREVELFTLKRRPDGGLKLTDGGDVLLYELEVKDDGIKLQDARNREVARVRVRDGKVSLRNPDDETLYSTKAPVSAAAAACLAFERMSLPLRVALLYRASQPARTP
ncbi:MAG TPA: hypothetical protein VLQ93_12085 [Myxococcaceae bacterium]|nr:hypothetical protein [Myxococcaceae bacterium]